MGKKEIIINSEKDQTRIAIVEDGELAELYFENTEHERTLGDIYLGRIRRIMPSIKAAFVDIGQKQDAFLHFSDLAENLEDLLAFVDQQNPKVSRVVRQAEHQRTAKRRRPKGGKRGKNSGQQDDDPQDGKQGGKHHVADAKTRSKRRSAQRRSRNKQGGKSSGKSERRSYHRGPQRGSPDLLKRNQRLLVKIVKEPISNKGSRVSSNISLAGRFLVLVPLADYTAVSKKITSHKERRRLRALAKMLLPDGFGVIVRTVAEGKDAKSLDTDLRLLLDKWYKIEKKLANKPDGPIKVHEDVNMASSIVRDLFSNDYDRILVDHSRTYRNIKNYIQAVAPQMVPAVQLYDGKQGIFKDNKLQKDLEEVFESRVNLPSGGYLFIERTEAMHVVDVNSGRSGRGMKQEDNSLKVNLEAARVLARQVRLRDLGGIIVIDFIDMRDERNKRKVYDELRKQFETDRAVTKILPMSDFGLMQITRQRLRPSITTTFSGPDGSVNGNGSDEKKQDDKKSEQPASSDRRSEDRRSDDRRQDNRRSDNRQKDTRRGADPNRSSRQDAAPRAPREEKADPAALLKEMEKWVTTYKSKGQRGAVMLRVHPFTAAYLNRKVPNHPTRWFLKHRVRVRMEADPKLDPMAYRFIEVRSGKDITEIPVNGQGG